MKFRGIISNLNSDELLNITNRNVKLIYVFNYNKFSKFRITTLVEKYGVSTD